MSGFGKLALRSRRSLVSFVVPTYSVPVAFACLRPGLGPSGRRCCHTAMLKSVRERFAVWLVCKRNSVSETYSRRLCQPHQVWQGVPRRMPSPARQGSAALLFWRVANCRLAGRWFARRAKGAMALSCHCPISNYSLKCQMPNVEPQSRSGSQADRSEAVGAPVLVRPRNERTPPGAVSQSLVLLGVPT